MGSNNRKKMRKQQRAMKKTVDNSGNNIVTGSIQKNISNQRTYEDRKFESLNIIYQLKQNGLTSQYPAVAELLEKLNTFVLTGIECDIHIPFPEKNKVIKGKLSNHKGEEVVVFLRHKDFDSNNK